MMTKADFEAIADALNGCMWERGNDPATVLRIAMRVGQACRERAKGDFDDARWLKAVTKETHVPLSGAS